MRLRHLGPKWPRPGSGLTARFEHSQAPHSAQITATRVIKSTRLELLLRQIPLVPGFIFLTI